LQAGDSEAVKAMLLHRRVLGKVTVCTLEREPTMISRWATLPAILASLLGCASTREVEPSGPIARFGSTPAIDGVFENGEWDDAQIVQVGEDEEFRIKHDGANLYLAFTQDGGNLYFSKDEGVHILHASAQLGSAEYTKSGDLSQTLANPFEWQLFGLQDEAIADIRTITAGYLAENGWVGSIGPLGNMAQAEWAVSFDWLGITDISKRFVETPKLYIFLARMRLSPEETEALMALPPEERSQRYPPLYWPAPPIPHDSLNTGRCPEVVTIDTAGWGTIWIDLEPRSASKPATRSSS